MGGVAGNNCGGGTASRHAATPYAQYGSEAPSALVVVLHGRYMNAAWMGPFTRKLEAALPHVRFLVPEKRNHEPGGQWFRGGAGPPHPPGIEAPRAQIVKEINELREQFAIPLTRVVLIGFSAGCQMAGYVAKEFYPEACGGLVLLSGGTQYKNLSHSEAVRTNMHVLLSVMSEDEGDLNENLPKLRDDMRSRGFQVAFREYEGDHMDAISLPESVEAVTDFLRQRIPPTDASPRGWRCERDPTSVAADAHDAAATQAMVAGDRSIPSSSMPDTSAQELDVQPGSRSLSVEANFASEQWVRTLLDNQDTRKAICDLEFKKFDKNNDGSLNLDELEDLVISVCAAMNIAAADHDRLQSAFEKCDVSHTGALSKKEFRNFFKAFLSNGLKQMS